MNVAEDLPDELSLVDVEKTQCFADRRECAFPNADDANFWRFQQRDREVRVVPQRKGFGEVSGAEPAGRPAADDQNVPGPAVHRCIDSPAGGRGTGFGSSPRRAATVAALNRGC